MPDFDPSRVVEDVAFNPDRVVIDPPAPERGMVRKIASAAGRGAMSELTGTLGKTLGLAAAGTAVIGDAIRNAVTGQNDTRAQDVAFSKLVDPIVQKAETYAPTEEESGSVPLSVASGLGALAVDLPLIALTGGKLGAAPAAGRIASLASAAGRGAIAMTPVAVAHGASQAETAVRQGVDVPTAFKSGAAAGATTIAGGVVPLAMRGGLGLRAATGALSGVATGEAGREVQNEVLSEYSQLQNPFTVQGLATNAATGALLGAALGPRPARTPRPVDAPTIDEVAPPAPVQQIGYTSSPNARPDTLVSFPDGSVGTRQDAEAYIRSLPEAAQTEARATLLGMGPQDAVAEQLARAEAETATAEPVPAASQKHAEDIAILRDAGEVPSGDPAVDAERAFALHNDVARAPEEVITPAAEPVSDRTNTQLQDALLEAQRTGGPAATKKAFTQIEAEAAARREREMTAIQNIAKGEQLAAAAERGEVPETAQTLAVPHNEFLGRLTELTPVDQKLPPKLKQELTQAVRGKQTYQEQLDAVTALRDGKKTNTVGFELLDRLHKELVPEPVAPVVAEAPAAEAPAAEPTVRDRAQAAADQLDATVSGFNARMRAGEKLEPAEQERYDEARALRDTMGKAMASRTSPDAYLNDLAGFATNTATPEAYAAQGPRLARVATPEEAHPGLEQVMRKSPDVQSTLEFMKENGSAPWVKDLASKLSEFGLDTKIVADAEGLLQGEVGRYDPTTREMRIAPGGASEHTALHEIMHAAMFDQVDQASQLYAPRNQAEAAKIAAYKGLEDLRLTALKKATSTDHYGLTNVHEFIAELNTNPGFQEFLSKKSLWQKTVDAVRKMLGLPANARTQLEKALSLQGEFFGKEQYQAAQRTREAVRKFDTTPKEAAEVTDAALSRFAQESDEAKPAINLKAVARNVFQQMLKWETTQYMVDRVKAVPEMVQSGFAAGAEGYERAYKARNLANEYAEHAPVKFATNVEHMLRGMDADAARDTNRLMSEIGTGSSIGGFDPTKNFDENIKTRPDLSTTNKAYINDVYRKYKQLEKSNPAAAKAIIDGAKVNRKEFVLDQATILSNLMRASGDNARRLEADLAQIDPADAEYARASARAAGATREANLAIQLGGGLDFMSKDVQSAKNTNPSAHIDGASDLLDKRVREAFVKAKELPADSVLRQQMGEMEKSYLNQIDNPYYHAGRSGEYFVKLGYRNMDQATWEKMQTALKGTNKILGDYTNQTHAFMRFDTLEQAQAAYRKMLQAGGNKVVVPESASGKLAEAGLVSNNAGISAALRSVLSTLHDTVEINGLTGEQAAAMKDAMTRKFLSMLPESSTRLATIKRMGVPGYDGDFLGSFARRAAGGVRDTANIYAMRGFSDAFKQMDTSISDLARTGDPELQTRAQMVNDEIKTRYYNGMQPVKNDHVNLINSLGHSFYLAAAPAYLIRSMAQPFHRAVPILGSRYGFVASAKEIGAATKPALQLIANSIRDGWSADGLRGVLDGTLNVDGMDLKPNEKAFIEEMQARGVLKLGQARQLQNLVIGGNPRLRDASRAAAMTIQYSDMVNRLATGLAAFRLAEKNAAGRGVEANTEYALKVVDNAMDNFDPNNTARAIGKQGFAGKVTPLMTAFLNYNFQTMQQIARTVHDGMFSRDTTPEGVVRSKEAKKELAGLMATTAMISGAMGLPFVSAFAGIYNALFQDEDSPGDIRLDARNALSDIFGEQGGNLLSHGVGALAGVDTSSFGLQDLLPGSQFLADRRAFKDKMGEGAKGLLGPSLNAGIDIAEAMIKLSDGQYVKGIEQALPSGLKGFWKAYEISQFGYTDAKGNPLGIDASPWDVAIQATGIRPETRAVQSEAANFFNVNQAKLAARRTLILDNLYKAVTRKDQEATQEAQAQIRAFNKANPMQPITDIAGVFRRHAQEQAVARASGTGVNANVKRLPVLMNDIRFTRDAMP